MSLSRLGWLRWNHAGSGQWSREAKRICGDRAADALKGGGCAVVAGSGRDSSVKGEEHSDVRGCELVRRSGAEGKAVPLCPGSSEQGDVPMKPEPTARETCVLRGLDAW